MSEQPEHAQTIIVAVKKANQLHWYVSNYDYWILDQRKLAESDGLDPDEENYQHRFDIPVVSNDTSELFLKSMEPFKVGAEYLRQLLQQAPSTSIEPSAEFFPSLFIDFDNNELLSMFPEYMSFEDFVPDSWIGKRTSFWERISDIDRYWIIDGRDYFASFGV